MRVEFEFEVYVSSSFIGKILYIYLAYIQEYSSLISGAAVHPPLFLFTHRLLGLKLTRGYATWGFHSRSPNLLH